MTALSKEFGRMLFDFLDGKSDIKKLEKWVYNNEEVLEQSLSKTEYLELISFEYHQKDACYNLIKLISGILEVRRIKRESYIESKALEALCVKNRGKYEAKDPERNFDGFTIGKTYNVISIQHKFLPKVGYSLNYTIIDDSEQIYLAPADLFKLTQEVIPGDWVFHNYSIGAIIGPKEWRNDFWDDFHNGEEKAILKFVEVLQKLNIKIPEKYRVYAYKLLFGDEHK